MAKQRTFTLPQEEIDEQNEYHGTNYDPRTPGRPPGWFNEIKYDWEEYFSRGDSPLSRRSRFTVDQAGTQGGPGGGSDPPSEEYVQGLLKDLGIKAVLKDTLGVELEEDDTTSKIINGLITNLIKQPKTTAKIAAIGYLEYKTHILRSIVELIASLALMIQGTEGFLKGASNAAAKIGAALDPETGEPIIDEIPNYIPGVLISKHFANWASSVFG